MKHLIISMQSQRFHIYANFNHYVTISKSYAQLCDFYKKVSTATTKSVPNLLSFSVQSSCQPCGAAGLKTNNLLAWATLLRMLTLSYQYLFIHILLKVHSAVLSKKAVSAKGRFRDKFEKQNLKNWKSQQFKNWKSYNPSFFRYDAYSYGQFYFLFLFKCLKMQTWSFYYVCSLCLERKP